MAIGLLINSINRNLRTERSAISQRLAYQGLGKFLIS